MDCVICLSLTGSLITILTFSEKYINKLCCDFNCNTNANNTNNYSLDYDELQAVNAAKKNNMKCFYRESNTGPPHY